MCNGQTFQVCVITRVQVSRLFHARQRHRVVIQLGIVGSLCIVHLCRLRIDGLAVLQQIEGCRELPLVLQVLSLEEEVFQSLGIIERERGSRSVECGMWSVECGVRCATTLCGHTRSHDHGNRGHHNTPHYHPLNGQWSIINLLHSGMTVSASTSFCLVKLFHNHEVTLLMLGNHHLGNALAIVNNKIFL